MPWTRSPGSSTVCSTSCCPANLGDEAVALLGGLLDADLVDQALGLVTGLLERLLDTVTTLLGGLLGTEGGTGDVLDVLQGLLDLGAVDQVTGILDGLLGDLLAT